jgi:2-aminoethylphosphonate transport system permease protein
VLFRSARGRLVALVLFALVFVPVTVAPFAVLAVAAFAGDWNGVLPGRLTGAHLVGALTGDNLQSLLVSVQTAAVAGLAAVAVGGWAAIAGRTAPGGVRRVTDALLNLPVAVPSVVVGLSLLVAFSRPPVLLNGTRWIVLLAHAVLVVAFAYATVSAALDRTDPVYGQVAAALGATPRRVLWRVRLPMLLPGLAAAASLSIALSMGEVGATIMVYPPDWRTLPVSVFALTDRGQVFAAAAETLLLLATTFVLTTAVGLVARRRGVER